MEVIFMDKHYDDVVDNRTLKEKVSTLWWSAKQWAKDHPKEAATIVVGSLAAFGQITKGIGRIAESHEERIRREKSIYDHKKGHYYELRRKPSNKEWSEIDRRHEEGETYSSILVSMRLI